MEESMMVKRMESMVKITNNIKMTTTTTTLKTKRTVERDGVLLDLTIQIIPLLHADRPTARIR